jgi:hypothetical protein
VIADPKPAPREKKPRKAIVRGAPKKRKTKIPPWKRNPDRYCTEGRCHRARRALMRCATHAVRELDSLWGRLVRSKGACEVCGKTEGLQAAHGFSRRYGPTRWVLLNGFALDHGCHVRYTHDPLGWDVFLRKQWGETVYEELRQLALSGGRPDYELTYATLAEAA